MTKEQEKFIEDVTTLILESNASTKNKANSIRAFYEGLTGTRWPDPPVQERRATRHPKRQHGAST